MKIPVNVRVFPGSEQERLELLAAVQHNCACKVAASDAVTAVDETCAAHALLADGARLKQLVFQRRWRRGRRAH